MSGQISYYFPSLTRGKTFLLHNYKTKLVKQTCFNCKFHLVEKLVLVNMYGQLQNVPEGHFCGHSIGICRGGDLSWKFCLPLGYMSNASLISWLHKNILNKSKKTTIIIFQKQKATFSFELSIIGTLDFQHNLVPRSWFLRIEAETCVSFRALDVKHVLYNIAEPKTLKQRFTKRKMVLAYCHNKNKAKINISQNFTCDRKFVGMFDYC